MSTLRKVPVLDDVTNLVPTNKLGTGTADSSKFLRGDQTWQVPASSGLNTVSGIIDFGVGNYGPEYEHAVITITGQSWVTNSSIIDAFVAMEATVDHDPDDVFCEGLTAYISNLVPSVGFDIIVAAPNNTWGKYKVYARGI